jgi:16S rRNA processing protein RimM
LPDKKSALSKSAPKAARSAPSKKAPPARRDSVAAKKSPPKPVKAAKPAPKATKAAPKAAAKTPAKSTPKPAAKASPPPKPAKAEGKSVTPGPKTAAKKAATTTAKPAPEARTAVAKAKAATKPSATKAAARPKAEKPVKAEKPPKAPKPPKPPKLAPVAAALAKPIPAKPLAVAAGRAQPIARSPLAPPQRSAPKPLAAPKPVATEPEVVGELQAVPAFKAKSGAKGMVLVGAVAGAFGVKGEVRLRAFTDKKEGVISYGPLYGEDGKILLRPKSWRELKDGVAVVAQEVKTREDAERLRGQKLYVPRANLPATADDEFYIVDLLGSRAEALDGTVLGDVVAVWNFGAGDILEYRPPNGGPNVRITFTKETVPHVDLAAKRVVIDPPAPEPIGK